MFFLWWTDLLIKYCENYQVINKDLHFAIQLFPIYVCWSSVTMFSYTDWCSLFAIQCFNTIRPLYHTTIHQVFLLTFNTEPIYKDVIENGNLYKNRNVLRSSVEMLQHCTSMINSAAIRTNACIWVYEKCRVFVDERTAREVQGSARQEMQDPVTVSLHQPDTDT